MRKNHKRGGQPHFISLYSEMLKLKVTHFLVRFPDPTYGVGREIEPLRSWEKNFGVTKLKKFQW